MSRETLGGKWNGERQIYRKGYIENENDAAAAPSYTISKYFISNFDNLYSYNNNNNNLKANPKTK